MIKYFDGTVFNVDADAIVNTVNTVGVMGAGIALDFALRYPTMYEEYKIKCVDKTVEIGKLMYYKENDKIIINFPTKWHFKYPSKLEWIEKGLIAFVKTYKNYNIKTVAFPKLGTSNGGLPWNKVKMLMEKYLDPLDILVYICLDNINEAQGKEAIMVNIINNIDLEYLASEIRLTKKQIQALKEFIPIKRFWHIKEIEGMGITAYSKIFNYCYNYQEKPKQISMFD